jgi:hypothetical protein
MSPYFLTRGTQNSEAMTDVMILLIFSPKKLPFLLYNKDIQKCKKFDRNIGFRENAIFFAKNWQKSQKIVIITSTPSRGSYGPHMNSFSGRIFFGIECTN